MSQLIITMQYATKHEVPSTMDIQHWLNNALEQSQHCEQDNYAVIVRIVDSEEMCRINTQFRNKAYATNVLAFMHDQHGKSSAAMLGDIVICPEILEQEAAKYQIAPKARWAHLLIHGLLHLLGYDHKHKDQMSLMEDMEQRIIKKLGMDNPYIKGNHKSNNYPQSIQA